MPYNNNLSTNLYLLQGLGVLQFDFSWTQVIQSGFCSGKIETEGKNILTLSAWLTKTDTCPNSVDPDEMAHNKPSRQNLHCLPFCFFFCFVLFFYFQLKPLFAQVDMLKFKNGRMEKSTSET